MTTPDPDRVLAMAEANEFSGFCLACGEEANDIEPDTRRAVCVACGAPKVYGAEELVLMGYAD